MRCNILAYANMNSRNKIESPRQVLGLLQLVHLFDNEVLSVLSLTAHLLLDWSRVGAHGQVMLDDFSWDSQEIRRFLGEHICVLLEEPHEIRFLPS